MKIITEKEARKSILKEADLEADNCFKQLKQHYQNDKYSDIIKEIEAKIKIFDFKNALIILNKLPLQ